jgi:hypothetical protein
MVAALERTVAALLSWALFALLVMFTVAASALVLAVIVTGGIVHVLAAAAGRLWTFSKGPHHAD